MQFYELPIEYYVNRLRERDYFAFAGYSDAEWFSIIRYDLGKRTGLGQIIDDATGVRLLDVLQRRHTDPNFLFASPKCIWEWDEMIRGGVPRRIEYYLTEYGITVQLYERDMVLDDLAHAAGLYPLIHQLQQMRTVVIGPEPLVGLDFLDYVQFFSISSPNFHMEHQGIEQLCAQVIKHRMSDIMHCMPPVYLISAGMSAALIIDQLYDHIPNSFFIDCGSIWDAFVGIGAQRCWRERLYANPAALELWKRKNIYGNA